MKKGVQLVLATAVISGVSIFLNKFGVSGMSPSLFVTAKNLLVGLFLFSFLLLLGQWNHLRSLNKAQWSKLALIGLIGGSVPFLLFFTGLSMTSAAQGALIHKTLFVWVALLATFFLREKISRNMLIGGALLIIGNLVILRVVGFSLGIGDLLILLATLFWAGEITLSKHLLKDVSGTIVAFGRMGFGSAYLLLYLVFTGGLSGFASLNSGAWLWILLTSVFLLGYVWTFYNGLATIPASTATAILLVGTVITTVLNLLWTGDIFPHTIIGSLFLVSGILFYLDVPWRNSKERTMAS
ncbi:DMT family transporter [Candidatus Woesearchaeota archaeon]|nr:DMT family transporter [Candidatus Woesearchaeota archaeon]